MRLGFKENIIKMLGGYTAYEYDQEGLEIGALCKQIDGLIAENKKIKNEGVLLFKSGAKLNDELQTLRAIKDREDDLEHYGEIGLKLKNMGLKMIKNKAYENKRQFKNVYYSVFLNELIIPEAYEVEKHNHETNNAYLKFNEVVWTDDATLDKSGDYYQMPNEVLARKKGDCEDMAYTNASINPEQCAVVYGFFHPDDKTQFGHAWNVILKDDQLLIYDSTNNVENQGGLFSTTNTKYEPYFIVTKNHTFALKENQEFGILDEAEWITPE